jgi:hypothetical protein
MPSTSMQGKGKDVEKSVKFIKNISSLLIFFRGAPRQLRNGQQWDSWGPACSGTNVQALQ